MKYRILGGTNLEVSEIGLGGMSIAGRFGKADLEQSRETIQKALELGVNFIDTATAYGKGESEKIIGEVIKNKRDKVFISTKLVSIDKLNAKAEFEQSIQRLQTEFVDILNIHSPGSDSNFERCMSKDGVFNAIKELQKEGRVKFIGITENINALDTLVKVVKTGEFDVIGVAYNIICQDAGFELLPLCKKNNIGVFIMSPLAQGALATRSTKIDNFLLDEKTKNLAQASIRYILSNPDIATVIPGTKHVERLEENCLISDGIYFPEVKLQRLKEIYNDYLNSKINLCKKFKGPGNLILQCFAYYKYFGLEDFAQDAFRNIKIKYEKQNLYDLCKSDDYPEGVDVSSLLKEAQNVFDFFGTIPNSERKEAIKRSGFSSSL